MSRDLDAQDAFVKKLVRETAELEAEVNELREQRDTCVRDRADLREGIQRVVDEEWDDLDPDDGLHLRSARLFLRGLLSRAALSPSDTERPLRQSNEPTPAHEWEDFE